MPAPLYFDYLATTPCSPECVEALLPYLSSNFGNPSSGHSFGHKAASAVAHARRQVAALLSCIPDDIIFTSGGTESNNMVILGVARALGKAKPHIIASAVEHPAVRETCISLQKEGFDISWCEVNTQGRVEPEALARLMRPTTALVTIMHSNNEVGTINDIKALAKIAHDGNALFHTDAAQSVGKIPISVDDLGVDFLSIAGHKVYAPKGVGALYCRGASDRSTCLPRIQHGAGQEFGFRAGTEAVPAIVGLGVSLELASSRIRTEATRLASLRDRLYNRIVSGLGSQVRIVVHGDPEHRLPNALNLGFVGLRGHEIVATVASAVACSAGSACHAGATSISPVLKAMGVDEAGALGAVRLSVGHPTSEVEVDAAAMAIIGAVREHLKPPEKRAKV